MWCYQKPGFEALLLTELQRQQQQRSQFCDTLLKTEGVSVPAHSCILSAISPHISAALSSAPPPPAGQSRLLDFGALGACSLLHMVRLLYSGEMAGEGEQQKQEAISAAARLGIHGLVEVTRRDGKCRREEGEGRAEVGVQTEPLMPEGNEERCDRWRREMRDGRTFLWKDTLSGGGKETWTQTEEPAGFHPAASYETIDLAALQSLEQTGTALPPSQIPYVPVSLIYPQDENQAYQPPSATLDSMQESTAAAVAPLYTSLHPFPSRETPRAADPHSWLSGPQRAAGNVPAAEEWTDEQFIQFQGNIPGYINYFLNPEKEESSPVGRAARGRRGAGAGTGERRARKPRGKTGARGRGGLMQTVDVQDVKEGKMQKLFLHRWGMRASKMGQGGGAAGRKLYLKTRELLKPVKKRIRRCKGLDFSLGGDVPLHSEEGAGNTQRGRKSATQKFNQDDLSGSAQRANLVRPSTSVFYNNTVSASSPSVRPPSPRLLSRASSLIHTTPNLPPAPPPLEENFDRLLEGELSEMLENFLLSFEQHTDSCAATEEMETGAQSRTEVTNDEAEPRKARALSAASMGTSGKVKEPVRRRKRRRKNEYLFSFEKKKVRKPASSSNAKTKMVHDRQDKQLQQMPVVKLERRDPLPARVTLQEHSCQSLEVKSTRSRRCRRAKNQQVSGTLKMYPIRSRFREARMESAPFLEQPLERKKPPSILQPHHTAKNNGQLVSLSDGENSTPSIQPQPVDEQWERHEEESTPPPQLEPEEPDRRGEKRGAESEEEMSDGAPSAKRVCFEEMPQLTPETCAPSREPADFEPAAVEAEDVIDVMTVSLTRVEDCSQRGEREVKAAQSEIRCSAGEEVESSGDEIIDVDGDVEGEPERGGCQSTTSPRGKPSAWRASRSEVSLRSTGSCEEDKDDDVDVIGGSSPMPDPVTINWTDTSEGEKEEGDEDVDVIGEKTKLSAAFATMSDGELVNGKHQTEALSC